MSKILKTDYLVIGAGPAAAAAAEAVRKTDKLGKIAVLSSEKEVFYSRPLISHILAGELGEKDILRRGEDFAKNRRLEVLSPVKAIKLMPKEHTVRLDGGKSVKWRKLIIAAGARPWIPAPLKDAANLRTFTTIADARRLEADIKAGAKKTVVVGGGFIGLKCAEALKKRGLSTTIAEAAPRILPSSLDETAAAILAEHIKKSGVDVLTNAAAASIDGKGKKLALADGRRLAADIIVAAAGVTPAIDFLDGSGVRADKGVLVGNDMRAEGFADVFAAGDCARPPGFAEVGNVCVPIWPAARETGRTAGTNAAGGKAIFDGALPMNSVEIFGLAVISAGTVNPPSGANFEEVVSKNTFAPGTPPNYKKLVFGGDGKLAGLVMLGDIARAGIYTGLIKTRADVSKFRAELSGDTFGFIAVGEETWKKSITPLEV